MKGSISKKLVLLTCILVGLLAIPACAEEFCITRNAPGSADTGQSFDVTLDLNGLQAGGIIETIPSGLSFVSTTFPDERYELEGQHLIFSVINDEGISYRLKARSSGTATISGKWDNALTKQNGEIENSSITVYPGTDGSSDENSIAITSELPLSETGNVTEPIHLKTPDKRAALDIPEGVCALDKNGKPIGEIGIATLKDSEIGNINGTDLLIGDRICRCSPAGATFSPAINLSFTFTENEWNSLPEGEILRVRHYDPENKVWIDLATTIDEENRTVYTSVSHFSIYGLFSLPEENYLAANITGDSSSQNSQTASPTKTVTKPDTTSAIEKTENSKDVSTTDTPDNGADSSATNPLFFGAVLVIVIIAIAAILLTGKNGEKKE